MCPCCTGPCGAVVQCDGKFVGIFSSWDIARECALDAKVSHPPRPRIPEA